MRSEKMSDKIKLLFISESISGGVRKHIVQLIENLNKEKFDIFFIHGEKHMDKAFLKIYKQLENDCTLIPCPFLERNINFAMDLKSFLFIFKAMKQINPDIVHCHSSKGGALGRLAAKKQKIKKVFYTPHAYSFMAPEFNKSKKNFFIAIEKFLSKFATSMTFCVSIGEKKEALCRNIDKSEKIEVIYNGLPEVEFLKDQSIRDQLGISSEAFLIGNNARMSEQKKPRLFFDIAEQLIKKDNMYHFVWAGDGPLFEEMKNFAFSKGLEKNIHLLGDRNDSEFIVKDYDVFLITSKYEGFPYAPIEALRAGIPIVGTAVQGNTEIIIEGLNGSLFDPKNKEKAIEAIESLRTSKQIMDKEKIIDSYKEKFSLEEMIKKIESFYLTSQLNS